MAKRPVINAHDDDTPAQAPAKQVKHPPPEDELGGGDICSPEESPGTDDDAPLP